MSAFVCLLITMSASQLSTTDEEQKKRLMRSAKVAETSIQLELTKISFFPKSAETFQATAYASLIVRAYRVHGKPAEGLKRIKPILQKLDALSAKKSPMAAMAAANIRMGICLDQLEGGDKLGALQRSLREMKRAKLELSQTPGDEIAMIRLAPALDAYAQALWMSHKSGDHAARLAAVEFISSAVGKKPKSLALKCLYAERAGYNLYYLTRFAYQSRVAREIDKLRKFVKQPPASKLLKFRVTRCKNLVASLDRIQPKAAAQRAMIGQPVPSLPAGEWVLGEPVKLARRTGQVVVIDFWGLTCAPCIRQLPRFSTWQKKYGKRAFVFVGVSEYEPVMWDAERKQIKYLRDVDRSQAVAAVKAFAEKQKIEHPLLVVDGKAKELARFHMTSLPQLMIVDQRGVVRGVWIGGSPDHLDDAEALLDKLLKRS